MGNFKDNLSTYLEKTDNWLWVFTAAATIYSLLLISDMQRAGEYNYLFTQIVAIVVGLVLAILISLVNYKYFIKYWWIFAVIGVGLAASVFVFGETVNGTDDTAWIKLPGGFTIQPSEFMKLCFIITFSKHLSYLNDNDKLKTPFGVIGLAVHLGVPIVLIHLQGDDGAVLIFLFMDIAMMFLAGVQA